MRRLSVPAAVALVRTPLCASAQTIDLVSLNARYIPDTEPSTPRPTKAQVCSYDVAVNVPLPVGDKTFLIPGLGYHSDAISHHDAAPAFVDLRVFQTPA